MRIRKWCGLVAAVLMGFVGTDLCQDQTAGNTGGQEDVFIQQLQDKMDVFPRQLALQFYDMVRDYRADRNLGYQVQLGEGQQAEGEQYGMGNVFIQFQYAEANPFSLFTGRRVARQAVNCYGPGSEASNTMKILQQGNGNKAFQVQVNGTGNNAVLLQEGNNNVSLQFQTGDGSESNVTQNGNNNVAVTIQTP